MNPNPECKNCSHQTKSAWNIQRINHQQNLPWVVLIRCWRAADLERTLHSWFRFGCSDYCMRQHRTHCLPPSTYSKSGLDNKLIDVLSCVVIFITSRTTFGSSQTTWSPSTSWQRQQASSPWCTLTLTHRTLSWSSNSSRPSMSSLWYVYWCPPGFLTSPRYHMAPLFPLFSTLFPVGTVS